MKLWKVKCLDCNKVFLADSTRHRMNGCPTKDCKNAVDLEEWYCRYIGNVKTISEFDAPWFEDEDDYHSAMLSWLNDIEDEEYELSKEDGTLLILKVR